MGIKCCLCGKNQSSWICDYPLSKQLTEHRICHECYNQYGKIVNAKSMDEVCEQIEYIKRIVKKNDSVDTAVSEYLDELFEESNRDKNKQEIEVDIIKKKEADAREKELNRINYAKSFNEFYEYDVVTIINENHGSVDKEKMMKILSEHARNGWKLHTIYSNELGKNALALLGFGVNSTACEDVLIFERRISEFD